MATNKKPKAHRISCVLNPLRDEMQNKLEIFYAVCWWCARARVRSFARWLTVSVAAAIVL